jgi:hypothetical protein
MINKVNKYLLSKQITQYNYGGVAQLVERCTYKNSINRILSDA